MLNKQFKMLMAGTLALSMALGGAAVQAAGSSEGGAGDKKVGLAIAAQEEVETEAETEEPEEVELSEETEKKVALSVAEDDTKKKETAADPEKETAAETETETEAKKDYPQLETTNVADAVIVATDVSQIVEESMPSIVSITSTSVQEVENYFYGTTESIPTEGAGSGVIIAQNDDELLIATNNHVVADTNELTVAFSVDADDAEALLAPAVIKGTNASNDLAVIAVKLSDINEDVLGKLKIATLGSSNNLKVGETAIVIGNALGTGQTVTTGIVSALEREVTTEAGTFTEVQVDAAVNLGCSGGAILNGSGQVIAITDAKATSDYAEGMGYGIPVDTAIPILEDLINRETRTAVDNHGYLGITVVPVSDEAVQMYNMPAGAYVYSVNEGEAADNAGIKQGDIITSFDGREIGSSDELVNAIAFYEAGETVTVVVQSQKDGKYESREVQVTLQEGPAPADDTDADTDQSRNDGDQEQKDGSDDQNPSDTDDLSRGNGGMEQLPQGNGWGGFFGGYGGLW